LSAADGILLLSFALNGALHMDVSDPYSTSPRRVYDSWNVPLKTNRH
jgi:hypothetical protein